MIQTASSFVSSDISNSILEVIVRCVKRELLLPSRVLLIPRWLRVTRSAKAFMRKSNSTGAILSPCLTPTPCSISSTLLPIFKTTIRSVYIRSTTLQRLGGAPYFSRTLMRSLLSYQPCQTPRPSLQMQHMFHDCGYTSG